MPKVDLIFIAVSFLLLPFMVIEESTLDPYIVHGCIFFIATFGIAHGAIDNHLYGVKGLKSNLKFIGVYLLLAFGFGLIWWIEPYFAFVSFMIVSAYHFGQSQFADLQIKPVILKLLSFIWGTWLLSAFVFLNHSYFQETNDQEMVSDFINSHFHYFEFLFYLSTVLLLGLYLFSYLKSMLKVQRVFRESYEMILICAAFYLYNPLLGFSLYFIILHSLRVLNQEYQFLLKEKYISNLLGFIKLLSPFTLISIFGMLAFLGLIEWLSLDISLSVAAIIFISSLTLPHALVMNYFYQKQH